MNRGVILCGDILCAWLIAVGCASNSPSVSRPDPSAVRVSDRAAAAFDKGDMETALHEYQRALQLSRATGEVDGIARLLTNLAIVQRALGDRERAHAYLAEVLHSPKLSFTDAQRARAALLEAMLRVEEGDLARGEEWVTSGLSLCRRSNCGLTGKFGNLQARIALARGDPQRAIAAATEGLEASKKQNDALEEANSLRLAADARALLADYDAARALYESAYRLDERLGHRTKAAAELRGIGRTHLGQGRLTEALDCYRRALALSESDGDGEGVAAARHLIHEAETPEQQE
jgi:tetratricopeptide (TPR) repeat protein